VVTTWLTGEENSFTTTRELDVFLALTVVFLGCFGLAALLRRPAAAGAGGGGR
jgi:hypothetical protein